MLITNSELQILCKYQNMLQFIKKQNILEIFMMQSDYWVRPYLHLFGFDFSYYCEKIICETIMNFFCVENVILHQIFFDLEANQVHQSPILAE